MINFDDQQGAIPDGQAPMGTDASDDAALSSDSQLDGKPADDGSDGMDVIKGLLDYGRQKNGITGGGKQQAGNIPAVPAGPGGDQTQPNPFGTRTPAPPFGKRGGKQFSAIDDDQMNQSFDDGGAVEDDPDLASNVGNRQINDMADSAVSKVRDLLPTPSVGAPNAPDRASQVGQQQLDNSADDMASDVGAALKSTGKAVAGAVGDAGAAEANTAGAIADPEGVQGMAQGAGNALGAISDAVSSTFDPRTVPGNVERIGTVPGNIKRIMNYLMGDAAPSAAVAQAEQAVDPQGQMPEGARKKAAIEAAMQQGGPEAAWPLLQANRLKSEALRHTASAAVDHGDLDQAAQLATKAYLHIPDGNDVHFVAGKGNVTATVTEGDKVITQQTLTPQQFKSYLTGQSMQFDNALETSPGVAIQQAAKQQAPTGPETAPFAGMRKQQPGQQGAPRGGERAEQPLEITSMEQAERVAARLFPRVSQEAQRAAFVEHIMQSGGQQYPSAENQASEKGRMSLERAKQTGSDRLAVAGVNAGARNYATDQHYGQGGSMDRRTASNELMKRAQIAASQGNTRRHDELMWSRGVLGNVMATPEDQARARGIIDRELGGGQQQGAPQPGVPQQQMPTGQPAAPASGQPGQRSQAPAAPVQTSTALKTVSNAAEYEALTPGEAYIDPKGIRKIKGK